MTKPGNRAFLIQSGLAILVSLASACSNPPTKVRTGIAGSGAEGQGNETGAGNLSLASCTSPIKTTYRRSRTEIANTAATLLNLSPAERDELKGALPVDPSTTGYENDLVSLQLTASQIQSLSFALDKVLTPARIKAILNCGDANDTADACVAASLLNLAKKAYSISSESSDSDVVLSSFKAMVSNLKTQGNERLTFAVKNIFLSMPFLFSSTDKEGFKAHLANTIWLGSGEYNADSTLSKLEDKAFIKALLNDPKSQRFVESFLMRRLKVDELTKGLGPDAGPRLKLLESMNEETKLFIWDIFKNNRPLDELLTSRTSFINTELAAHYGMPDPGEGFRKVELPANRQGLLTQGSVLTVTSKTTESNIIARGLWIVEKVLCQHIPAAPDVSPLKEPDGASAPTTPRQRLEAHRALRECAICHDVMDPPGFALENFGPLGQYREKYENGLPIDSKAVFADQTVTQTPNEFFAYVDKNKAAFTDCFSKELLTYTMRRVLKPEDKCAVDTLARGLTEKHWGLETALTEILSWYKK